MVCVLQQCHLTVSRSSFSVLQSVRNLKFSSLCNFFLTNFLVSFPVQLPLPNFETLISGFKQIVFSFTFKKKKRPADAKSIYLIALPIY